MYKCFCTVHNLCAVIDQSVGQTICNVPGQTVVNLTSVSVMNNANINYHDIIACSLSR